MHDMHVPVKTAWEVKLWRVSWDISHDIASPQNPQTHDNYILYWSSGASLLPCGPLFVFSWRGCKPCTRVNANDACRDLFPQKKDTVVAELYGIPTGSISLHCVCLCTLATRNPPGLLRHQLVLYLSLYQVCSALFFWLHHHVSISLWGTHCPFPLNYPKHMQPHTDSRSPAHHLRNSGIIMQKERIQLKKINPSMCGTEKNRFWW